MVPEPTPEARKAFRDLTGREMHIYPEQGKFARAVSAIALLVVGLALAGLLFSVFNPFEVML